MVDCYVGEIRLFAGNFAPVNWSFCRGQLLQISQNNVLYALIGTTYGGDGSQTFGLPDLQGRAPIHMGQGTGLTNRALAAKGGTETVTLATAEMPAHSHTLYASTAAANTQAPTGAVPATVSPGSQFVNNVAGIAKQTMASTMIQSSGNSQPHNNLMPTMALSYIIALQGLFPVRS